MQKHGKHELPQESRATGAIKLGTAAAGKATEYGVHLAYTGGDWEKAYDNMGGAYPLLRSRAIRSAMSLLCFVIPGALISAMHSPSEAPFSLYALKNTFQV